MKALRLWVIEMLCEHRTRTRFEWRFEPTVGVWIDREGGRRVLREWKRDNPGSIRAYVPERPERERTRKRRKARR